MNEGTVTGEYGDPALLIESVRKEAARRMDALDEKAKAGMRMIEAQCEKDIRAFREARGRETDAAVEKAVYIMKNRAAIEKRKLWLNAVEDFIKLMIGRALEDFIGKERDGYVAFLKREIADVLSVMRDGDILIRLSPRDAGIESELRALIDEKRPGAGGVEFVSDEAISPGGVILEDQKEGLVYNRSLDRIVTRTYDTIRKEVMAIVQEHARPAD